MRRARLPLRPRAGGTIVPAAPNGVKRDHDRMSQPEHPIETLRRADRHSLGAGDGVLFAHPHPRWLHRPGFWDGVQWYTHLLRPAYMLSVLDHRMREIPLRETFRSWTPAMLVSNFVGGALQLTERRVVLAGGVVASDCTLVNGSGRREALSIALWTAQEGETIADRAQCGTFDDSVIRFRVSTLDVQQRNHRLPLDVTLRFDSSPDLRLLLEAQHARGYENQPDWSLVPLHQTARRHGTFRVMSEHSGGSGRTLLHFALIRHCTLEPGASLAFTAGITIGPAGTTGSFHSDGPSKRTSTVAPRHSDAAEASNNDWRLFFENAPLLTSSEPHLERFFTHRLYGLRLNYLAPHGNYRQPTCAEGTEFFHQPISYSAWVHARELCWFDAERARGAMRTFFDHQKDDGRYPGIIYVDATHPTANYLADWGGSLNALDLTHPDGSFLRQAWRSLSRYAAWLARDRDPDATGLYRVRDPYETGQEYMSRYTAVRTDADTQHFDYTLDLLGVDITVYAYRLHRALERAARQLGERESRRAHARTADRIGDAILSHMWDPRTGLFSDIDPRTGERTGIKAAVCFYPWLTDVPGIIHVAGLESNLFDARTFRTPYPVPSTSADDPTYDPDGFWRGVRRNCPWNGRVWPMTNCHVAEALAITAVTHAPHLRSAAADLIMRTIRMMFFDGDPARPNSFEHYSPVTGEPCTWRGLDDYQHSWLNDLIVRWIIGFRPVDNGFIVDPLPADIERARIERLSYRGKLIGAGFDARDIFVSCNGRSRTAPRGESLTVSLAEFDSW